MHFIGNLSLLAVLAAVLVDNASAWDQEEFEIFDLVEEINENFYSVLKIEQVNHWKIVVIYNNNKKKIMNFE